MCIFAVNFDFLLKNQRLAQDQLILSSDLVNFFFQMKALQKQMLAMVNRLFVAQRILEIHAQNDCLINS